MNVKRSVHLLALFVVALGLTGCATMFKKDHEMVCFESTPEGADVYINGSRFGKTPLSLDLSSKKSLVVTFKKDGFADKTCIINTKIAAGYVVLDVIGGFIPVLIDAATENWYSLETNYATAYLEPAYCNASPVEIPTIR